MNNAHNFLQKKLLWNILLCIAFFLSLDAHNDSAPLEKQISSHQTSEETRAKKLLAIVEKEFRILDSLSDILQYLGQAMNKGAIKAANKTAVYDWIEKQQQTVREIKNLVRSKSDLTAAHLGDIAHIMQLFSEHIDHALESRLQDLTLFNIQAVPERKPVNLSLDYVDIKLARNELSLPELRVKANRLGLTRTNLLVRKIDEINERYGIVSKLTKLSVAAAIGICILYLMPEEFLFMEDFKTDKELAAPGAAAGNGNPAPAPAVGPTGFKKTVADSLLFQGLRAVKRWLGPQPQRSRDGKLANKLQIGALGRLEDTCNRSMLLIGGVSAFSYKYLGNDIYNGFNDIGNDFRNEWSKLKGFTVADNRTRYKTETELTLDDERLIGLDEQKQILRNIAHYVINPEAYDNTNSAPPKSILITGPSGSGKSFLAKALHGTINDEREKLRRARKPGFKNKVSFKQVQWRDIVTRTDGIKSVIEDARRNAPCVIFLDELHNFPLQTNGYSSEELYKFLIEIQGINDNTDTKAQIIVIAATNKEEYLDQALLRAGRFGDERVRCEKPNLAQRKDYFSVMFKRNSIDTAALDLDQLAQFTAGCTFSDLESILKGARFNARLNAQGLTQQHLRAKIDTHVNKIKQDLPLTQEEKHLVAVHQAGHALLYFLRETTPTQQLQSVTIHGIQPVVEEIRIWDSNRQQKLLNSKNVRYGKIFTYDRDEMLKVQTPEDKIKFAKITLAGALAESMLLQTNGSSYHAKDRKKAFNLIKQSLLKGLNEEALSEARRNTIADKTEALLEQLEAETKQLLIDHQEELILLAEKLEERGKLDATEIRHLLSKPSDEIQTETASQIVAAA